MAYETIKYEVDEQILTITLNRPDKLNAFNGTMQQELIDAFDAADKDDAVRAIIVTGAGRGFCAGADLSSGANTFDRDARRGPVKRLADGKVDYSDPQVRDGGGQVTLRIFKCLKPVIAAVNGPAVGIGVTMQLAMDIRIASEAARFGFVFSQRGIVPEAASSWFLPRLVGISQALEWCYTGRVFPAQEALAGRLVSRVVPADELLPTARALAREIAENLLRFGLHLFLFVANVRNDVCVDVHRRDARIAGARNRLHRSRDHPLNAKLLKWRESQRQHNCRAIRIGGDLALPASLALLQWNDFQMIGINFRNQQRNVWFHAMISRIRNDNVTGASKGLLNLGSHRSIH